jgi:hypothetical protein
MAEIVRAKVEPYKLRGFKGVNKGVQPQNIHDSEFQDLENFYPFEGVLQRRSGLERISQTPHSEKLNSLFAYKVSAGTWTLIAGTETRIAKMNSGSAMVSISSANTYTSSEDPFAFVQYKDIVYAARSGVDALQRTDGLVVMDAGIPAPSVAPAMADGAAGAIIAGAYYGVYTFYNSDTGAESNPSPASAVLNAAGSKKIDWTAVAASSNGQVNARRLYRTLVGQSGEYYLVATITDNFTTTATENVIQADMGIIASYDNGTPPADPSLVEIFQERAWVTDGVDVYFSELGLPESYGDFSIVTVTPDDGHKITGLKAFGERLLIGKTNGVHFLTGTDEQSFEIRVLTDRHGVFSHHSMQVAEGHVYWFGGDNFYQSDGSQVRSIGDVQIRSLVDGIDAGDYDKITAAVDATNSWYIAKIVSGGSDYLVVYNYKSQEWTTFLLRHRREAYHLLSNYR